MATATIPAARFAHRVPLLGAVAAVVMAYALSRALFECYQVTDAATLAHWLRNLAGDGWKLAAAAVPAVVLATMAFERGPRKGWRRGAVLVAGVLAAASAGLFTKQLLAAVVDHDWARRAASWRLWMPELAFEHVVIIGAIVAVAECRRRLSDQRAREDSATLHALDAERERDEARLQVLRAQAEPHFLFNTLAAVRWLVRTDPPRARAMLDDFARYATAALPQMRHGGETLATELELAAAFVNLHKVRMGERLAFSTVVEEGLAAARVPSLTVLTLVENAVKHGVAPRAEGGRIDVVATRAGNSLVVHVSDDGRGFFAPSGNGRGLANIRARLASEYGAAASLVLAHRQPRGVTATLTMPLHAGAAP